MALLSALWFTVSVGSVQSLSCVWLFATPWITACQASLTITNSRSLRKLMPIESVMPSSHLILCCPLLLLPPIPPSIRVFSNESTLRMRWPKWFTSSPKVSQKDKHQYNILKNIYGILKDGNDNPICKMEKETQMYRTDFWTLWEKVRVGWSERTASKHVYYQVWNRSPVQVGCTGMTQKDGMGKEGGSGWGSHVNPWLICVRVWQKPLQYYKVVSLQLTKINEKN